jgi:AraC-like DNA-binding protein/quercetin dioxygenase-like cupin family protein
MSLIDAHRSVTLSGARMHNVNRRPLRHLNAACLSKILSHVEANLESPIRVATLAALAAMNPTHFSRVFKQTLGTSPGRYVRLRRLEAAQKMLRTTTEELSAIAVSCGLADQSHLTRIFRKLDNGRAELMMECAQAFSRSSRGKHNRQLEKRFHKIRRGGPFSVEKDGAIVTPLLSKELVGIPGKEVATVKVESLAGGASLPHRHDANVLVYVLEGSLIMQAQGKDPVTLKPGDTLSEKTPTDIHLQSANASKTQPVKFIAIVIKDKGGPVTRPVTPAKSPLGPVQAAMGSWSLALPTGFACLALVLGCSVEPESRV